ncbi:hypothetical protein I79_024228 [Cricetulus griseus]|uniref:Uncharacterized protein n=1 Tax=Cricetulus griseus TaxID=10029 RepID=G3IK35_CRIGR|nr:hypothetical protein I79_024228 [Cricetulus griseus]
MFAQTQEPASARPTTNFPQRPARPARFSAALRPGFSSSETLWSGPRLRSHL